MSSLLSSRTRRKSPRSPRLRSGCFAWFKPVCVGPSGRLFYAYLAWLGLRRPFGPAFLCLVGLEGAAFSSCKRGASAIFSLADALDFFLEFFSHPGFALRSKNSEKIELTAREKIASQPSPTLGLCVVGLLGSCVGPSGRLFYA